MPTENFREASLPAQGMLATAGLQPTAQQTTSAADRKMAYRTSRIITYLLDQSSEFQRLADFRRKGWENPAGDKFFEKQRRNADKIDEQTSRFHFQLMQKIGNEIHYATLGFVTRTISGKILDMCAAPGGFLATALRLNPDAEFVGFSLPPSDGGYNVLLPSHQKRRVQYLDVTMLAADIGVTDIPKEHPDSAKFLPRQIEETLKFELVICDGQVLRTHNRPPYRESREPTRLTTTQLAVGLQHLSAGGTIIVLLHKVELWQTANLLWTFQKFSSIKLFKPTGGHAKRSSFYMVATKVESDHPEARRAIEKWIMVWRAATFGTDAEYADALEKGEPSTDTMLAEFGPELVRQGTPIWDVQAQALAKAPFVK